MSSLIFGWGLNQNKILTYPKKKTILHKPTLLTYFKNFKGIQNIACGTIRSIYLSKEGKFASFSRALLRRDFKLYDIKFVACSGEHFLIQNSKDELYVIGLNNFGQLGLENYRQRKTFQKQIFFEEHKIELKKIVFGKFSSYFLSKENGDFYGCGSNLNGELGLKYETVRVVSPRLLQSNIFNIFSGKGSKFVFILNKKGLFATGRNNCGQLGIGSERLKFFSFTKVPIPEEYTIVEIIGGANHTLLLALDGEFKQRFLASGTKFKCGLGENCFSFKEFTFFADKPIKQFDCGELHSMVLTQDSKLYVWGNSDYGQLGLGELTDKMTPTQLYIEELQNVKNLKIHAGSFSSFIWQESIEEIQEDFLNLFQNEYCWDLELYGFKVHKILVEHRLNSNLKKINKVLSNYSKSEIEILLYWVYSGSSDDIEILKQICLNFEIEDPLSKHLVDDLNELFESKKSADFVLKINETIKTGKKKKI
ncbi:regulator of chromosome condensation [Anaeramoeba flamelloides]|uniref:Regulator of chromosome condensation n=1 Tax=Anaeramoeba flamelloides TaxID=1746091 RepID=A0AAV7ZC40_9EUKA|nr:regulator of chromosome condensation [Anaeramoeba flamelloides]